MEVKIIDCPEYVGIHISKLLGDIRIALARNKWEIEETHCNVHIYPLIVEAPDESDDTDETT